jgi:hypothetical protein
MSETAIVILWKKGPGKGRVTVAHGTLRSLALVSGKGACSNEGFDLADTGPARVRVTVADANLGLGAQAARVSVEAGSASFAFFLRDVTARSPVWLPDLGAAVVPDADPRAYADVANDVQGLGLLSAADRIAREPEESYENACRLNRKEHVPTWLGVGRDIRIFAVDYSLEMGYWGYVLPRRHSIIHHYPELENQDQRPIEFVIGHGSACRYDIARRLEDGTLPILHSVQREDDLVYRLTAFATLEKQTLSPGAVRGTHWLAAYANTGGNMLTAAEKQEYETRLVGPELDQAEQEVVCCVRVTVANEGAVPRYAWFRTARLRGPAKALAYDGAHGLSHFTSGRVYAASRLNGAPMPQEEMAVLLAPGQTARFEMLIPNQPISRERGLALATLDFDAHHRACRDFWRARLASAATIEIPEAAVDERVRAGLLHCDLVALGREPNGPVAATIGWYAPIGSESAPIIQFFDSMGWHQLAERSLDFFFTRQREDGFIQTFGGYQLETGPALWTAGEHYRYTRDLDWVRRVQPNLLKAAAYLLAWRDRNKRNDLRGLAYGLQEGKVADPEDFYHSFMLNAVSYLGIQRVGEMLGEVNPAESARLLREAAAYREDIRRAFADAVARAPAVPLGDGSWRRSFPPWPEYAGPVSLYADGGTCFTHGAFGSRDSIIGAMYLPFSEVLDPGEPLSAELLQAHQELYTVANAALTQPYYCRHDWLHLQRGEVKAFLKTFYNQFTALQDRETYTFWEHYFHASQHKTHEEAWFLMQVRWMLYLEQGCELNLFPGIPRAWLQAGRTIRADRVASYFGSLSFEAAMAPDENVIRARVRVEGDRRPKTVRFRLPHPRGLAPARVTGGLHDPATETLLVPDFTGEAVVELRF